MDVRLAGLLATLSLATDLGTPFRSKRRCATCWSRHGGDRGMAPTGSEISIPSTIAGEEKIVKGCFYGSTRPAVDLPHLVDFCLHGVLQLDRMIIRTYLLAEINAAFDALSRGDNARGVVTPTS
jgi:Zn-dependent alcohol dehydrogenase